MTAGYWMFGAAVLSTESPNDAIATVRLCKRGILCRARWKPRAL